MHSIPQCGSAPTFISFPCLQKIESVLQKQSKRKGAHVYFIRNTTTIETATAIPVVTATCVFPNINCCAIAVIRDVKPATSATMTIRAIVDRLFCSLMRSPLKEDSHTTFGALRGRGTPALRYRRNSKLK